MKIVFLPPVIKALVFDIDQTLYDNRPYFESQSALLIQRLAMELGQPIAETDREIKRYRAEFARANEGRVPSLGNTFLHFGVSIEQNVRWREELFKPEDHLHHDARLVETLRILASHFSLTAVTNNPTSVGRRTLTVLGVESFFAPVIGLELAGESKPSMVPFNMVADMLGISLTTMVSLGDRMEIDIELPVSNGMGGILIESLTDVYDLPNVLASYMPS